MSKIYSSNLLDLVTNSYAVAAKNALACVTGDTNRGGVLSLIRLCTVGETNALDVKSHRKVLKLTLVVVLTNGTVAAVICQEKLKNVLAVATKSFGVGLNRHACLGRS